MTTIVITRDSGIRVFRNEAKSKKDVHDDIIEFRRVFENTPTNKEADNFFKELGYSPEHALGITMYKGIRI